MSAETAVADVIVGSGPFRYRALPAWGELPAGWSFAEVVGVATDARDRVYVFNRGEHPMIVFDRDGRFLASWGEGLFVRAHGVTIGPGDDVYCTDDLDHTVRKFLDSRGPGFHHASFEVADLDAALARARAAGVRLIDERPRAGAHDSRVAFIHPKSTFGMLVELCQARSEPKGGAPGTGEPSRLRSTPGSADRPAE